MAEVFITFGCYLHKLQLIEGSETVGSWPALGEVAQKAKKDTEKENKPVSVSGGKEEEGEVTKVTVVKEKRSSSGGGGGERRASGGSVTRRSDSGESVTMVMEKGSDSEANGDSQRLSGRRKGAVICIHAYYNTSMALAG